MKKAIKIAVIVSIFAAVGVTGLVFAHGTGHGWGMSGHHHWMDSEKSFHGMHMRGGMNWDDDHGYGRHMVRDGYHVDVE